MKERRDGRMKKGRQEERMNEKKEIRMEERRD